MTQSWRAKKYHCIHLVTQGENKLCSQDLCAADDILECCVQCSEYQGRDRGLGDTIKRATNKLGIKSCGKCQKRREALNRATNKFFGRSDNDS